MSDFDKEAERERLREKYEDEEQKREVTERMSELLLKGATMTNAHCQDCGDPIFRYDGQEFCATCQKTVQRETDDGGEGEDAEGGEDANGDREELEVATPDETRVQFGGDGAEAEAPAESPEVPDREPEADEQPAPEPPTDVDQPRTAPSGDASSAGQSGEAPLEAAHVTLEREVARLAKHAAATDDLGHERDLLAATREAAEALAAVREATR
jgi:uncharacterized Zn finger protein (UPF0148 family)